MYRYIALTWPKADTEKSRAAREICQQLQNNTPDTQWETAATGDGFLVLHTGAVSGRLQAYPLREQREQSNGIILGKLFTKDYIDHYQVGDPAPAEVAIDNMTCRKIVASGGQYLVDNYWGRYVAILHNPATDSHHVLSDPSGGIPCFYTQHRGVQLYFAYITDCDAIADLHFAINWEHLRKRMISHMILTDDTGLEGVYKLLPGECRTTSADNDSKAFYWNPYEIARQAITQPPAYTQNITLAAAELRRVTMGCLNTWASCYQHILLSLSGGLDSTIIAGCLARANPRPKVTAINYYDAGNDERWLARLAAESARFELLERSPGIRPVSEHDLAVLPRTPKLADYHYGLQFAGLESKLAAELGADTKFIGQGGDEMLYAPHDTFSAVDYARQKGLFRPGLLRAAMDIALIGKVSLKEVLNVVRLDRFKQPFNPLFSYDTVKPSETVSADIRNRYGWRDALHPLTTVAIQEGADPLPPGKLHHITTMLAPYWEQSAVMPADYLEEAYPLYSQPLIDLCAQLPTYLLTAGGKSRGLARLAFADDIPPEIANRESKGCGTSYHKVVFEQSRALAKAVLLSDDCILVREKLVDRDKLQQALTGTLAHLELLLPAIKPYLSIESWLRKWEQRRPKNSESGDNIPKRAAAR